MHVLVTSIPLRYFRIFGAVIALLCTLSKCTVCVQSLVGVASLVFEIFVFLQIWPNFPFGPWTIVHGGETS